MRVSSQTLKTIYKTAITFPDKPSKLVDHLITKLIVLFLVTKRGMHRELLKHLERYIVLY